MYAPIFLDADARDYSKSTLTSKSSRQPRIFLTELTASHIASADYSVQRARQAKAAADETAREREIQLQKAEARAERVRGDNLSSGVKVKCFSCCGA